MSNFAETGSARDPLALEPGGHFWRDSAAFLVWAPHAKRAEVRLVGPEQRTAPLLPARDGYKYAVVEGLGAGTRYFYRIDGDDLPDPASRFQPEGVHGPSEIVSEEFAWTDAHWGGVTLENYVIYELHVGTFTPEGTFDAVIPHLDSLAGLGVTAIEIMPVAQFPGARNWGYDGVQPYAPQNSYGGPEGLRRLVDAAHARGLAMILDVVYNHLGPEGNYLSRFGPYFTDRHQTPWGQAINFDGPDSAPVRRYFVENAVYWVRNFHFDALRLDAVHGIVDDSPRHILQEITEAVHAAGARAGRKAYVLAESDLNDPKLVRTVPQGGYGLDAQWADDLHHALHTLLTGEKRGYYADFGTCEQLAKAYRTGYVYTGEYSQARGRPHGAPPEGVPKVRFVVCSQNHDQTGNRMLGERLTALVPYEGLKLAAGAVLLSPFLPLLFMGEEYGETAPFQYFASHSDPGLIEAVRAGRRKEFEAFRWQGEVPDAEDPATFERSRLNHALRAEPTHARLLEFYKTLIAARAEYGPSTAPDDTVEALPFEDRRAVSVRRRTRRGEILLVMHFGRETQRVEIPVPDSRWRKRIDSAETRWLGPGSAVPAASDSRGSLQLEMAPLSFCLFRREV